MGELGKGEGPWLFEADEASHERNKIHTHARLLKQEASLVVCAPGIGKREESARLFYLRCAAAAAEWIQSVARALSA